MTKKEIQEEYDKLAPIVGQRLFQWAKPAVELWAGLQRMLFLNQEMGRIREEEAQWQREQEAKKHPKPAPMQVPPDTKSSTSPE